MGDGFFRNQKVKISVLQRSVQLLAAICILPAIIAGAVETPLNSPENQIFQFMERGSFEYVAGTKRNAAAYLWIPEQCQQLRGLLILGQNVPEHLLVGHPALRKVCAEQNLGIVWSTPSYFNLNNQDPAKTVAFLQQLLNGLAKTSGYDEVATVPWLPIGESMHLKMVGQLLDVVPARCIAGVFVKNGYLKGKNRETPVLMTIGTSQEWDQENVDIRTRWQDLSVYDNFVKERTAFPKWPASILVDGGSGHFDCPEPMIQYIADYTRAAVEARLPKPGEKEKLKPVTLDEGYVAELPLPGRESFSPARYSQTEGARHSTPWFFNKALASTACSTAAINWKAKTQIPVFLNADGTRVPMAYRGITRPIPVKTGADGITFELKGEMLAAIPENFVAAGTPLAQAPGTPTVEWICGPVTPLGQGRFRIALDRSWPHSPAYFALRQQGTPDIRPVVEPGGLNGLEPNTNGLKQSITFAPIPDVPAGTKSVTLTAISDSGMPVRFFVLAGPAVVEDGRLELTPIPPRTRFPVNVTITAWQWGRSEAPQVQTAPVQERSFHILKP